MATFKVNDKVRVIKVGPYDDDNHKVRALIGSEGRVKAIHDEKFPFEVEFASGPRNSGGHIAWGFAAEELAPLTDPRASEFIADMERFAHVAKTTKVTA